jgi:hypothetical protein
MHQTLEGLIKQVEEHIQSQWKPQGGLVAFQATAENDASCLYFAQAVVQIELVA